MEEAFSLQVEPNSAADLQSSSIAHLIPVNFIEFQRREVLHDLQSTVDRYNDAFRFLSFLLDDLAILRQENLLLKEENVELSMIFEDNRKRMLTGVPVMAEDGGEFLPAEQEIIEIPLGSLQVGEADGVGISVEVFNQGMAKTELCNKWEDMGWCPYGDQCQFAHGVDELRPVIRHPRYKTQLCRMVAGPGGCPYGHRCHFRHSQNGPDGQ